MIVGAYMDESFDQFSQHSAQGIFSVGTIIGRGVATFGLECEWEKLRNRPDIGIAYFKASECEKGFGEFARFCKQPKKPTEKERERLQEISLEFLSLIPRQENIMVMGFGVVQDDFLRVIASDKHAKSILGDNPYRLAYDLAMIQCAWAMQQLSAATGTEEQVAFVCDEHEKYSPFAPQAYTRLKDKNPHAARYMGSFSSGNDKECQPLQAADAVAYEIRRALNLHFKHRAEGLRKQMQILTTTRKLFLIQTARERHFREIAAAHQPGEPFDLRIVMEQHFDEDIKFAV